MLALIMIENEELVSAEPVGESTLEIRWLTDAQFQGLATVHPRACGDH